MEQGRLKKGKIFQLFHHAIPLRRGNKQTQEDFTLGIGLKINVFTFIYITFRKAIKISPVRCKNLQKSLILCPDQIYYYLKSTQTSRHFIRKSSSDYRPLLILEEAQTCKPLVSESVSTLPEYQVILAICQHQAMKPRDYI